MYKNLKAFTKGKKPDEDIFDTLTPSRLNDQARGGALGPRLAAHSLILLPLLCCSCMSSCRASQQRSSVRTTRP